MTGGRGFTLVELMVSTVLMAILISLVFYSWNYMSRRMAAQQQKISFQCEAGRLAWRIVNEIRRSPEVITWSKSAIEFLSADGADTLNYTYDGENLEKNGSSVQCLFKGGKVTRFTIDRETPASEMLLITFGMEDQFGNQCLIPLKVRGAGS